MVDLAQPEEAQTVLLGLILAHTAATLIGANRGSFRGRGLIDSISLLMLWTVTIQGVTGDAAIIQPQTSQHPEAVFANNPDLFPNLNPRSLAAQSIQKTFQQMVL